MLEQMKNVEDQLEDALNEVEKTKLELKTVENKIYYANKKDKIDACLGNFLNNFPEREKIKIMFLRESEGVYQFGQRKVFIKIEKGDNILVRVGGGFMHIKEFIEKFTHLEQDKIEGKEVIDRF